MSRTIELPFEIGETVWHTGYGSHEEWDECPECAGTCRVTLVRGSGEAVSVPCVACAPGFESPTGRIRRLVYDRVPTPFLCAWVEVRYMESDTGCGSIVDAKHLFRNRDECLALCSKMNDEQAENHRQQLVRNLESKRRDLAWSVHYWSRKVKDLERDLEVARQRFVEVKQASK